MRVNRIDVLYKLDAVFCLLDDRSVIHIPEPQLWRMVGSVIALASNSSMKRLATVG